MFLVILGYYEVLNTQSYFTHILAFLTIKVLLIK